MLVFSKALLFIFALIWAGWTFKTIRLGLREHKKRQYSKRSFRPEAHRFAAIAAYCLLWCIIAEVMAIHFFVPHHTVSLLLMLVHVPAALVLLTLMSVMLFWKTGIKDARMHRRLAALTIVLFPIVLVTSGLLTAEL